MGGGNERAGMVVNDFLSWYENNILKELQKIGKGSGLWRRKHKSKLVWARHKIIDPDGYGMFSITERPNSMGSESHPKYLKGNDAELKGLEKKIKDEVKCIKDRTEVKIRPYFIFLPSGSGDALSTEGERGGESFKPQYNIFIQGLVLDYGNKKKVALLPVRHGSTGPYEPYVKMDDGINVLFNPILTLEQNLDSYNTEKERARAFPSNKAGIVNVEYAIGNNALFSHMFCMLGDGNLELYENIKLSRKNLGNGRFDSMVQSLYLR